MAKDSCSKCGSTKIIPKVHIIDRGGGWEGLKVVVYENPTAIVNKKRSYSELSAKICGNCGHTEITATKFEKLYSAYKKSKSK